MSRLISPMDFKLKLIPTNEKARYIIDGMKIMND